MKKFNKLGVGVGYRVHYRNIFLNSIPKNVEWVEVVSENILDFENLENRSLRDEILKIRAQIPVVMHGVSMNLGTSDPINKSYLKELKRVSKMIEAEWVSDHLCWTGVHGRNTHDLLPIPYNSDYLEHFVTRVHEVQDFLGHELVLENPSSYVQFKASDRSEWDFLRELALRTGCKLLLDINNIYVSSVNHKFNPLDYLAAIPKEAVVQIHLAGHLKEDQFIIDTHDSEVSQPVWDLLRVWLKDSEFKSIMIERDDQFPEWPELSKEIDQLHHLRKEFSGVSKSYREFSAQI